MMMMMIVDQSARQGPIFKETDRLRNEGWLLLLYVCLFAFMLLNFIFARTLQQKKLGHSAAVAANSSNA